MDRMFIADQTSTATVISLYRRQLQARDAPFASPTSTPQLAAGGLFPRFGDLLELTASELENLSLQPRLSPKTPASSFGILGEKQQFEHCNRRYNQTALGCGVQAGVAVQMKTAPFRVLSHSRPSIRHSRHRPSR